MKDEKAGPFFILQMEDATPFRCKPDFHATRYQSNTSRIDTSRPGNIGVVYMSPGRNARSA